MRPVAPARGSRPPWELSRETGPLPAVADGSVSESSAAPGTDGDFKGLPRRVKQASLAPQLRADPPLRATRGGGGVPGGGMPGGGVPGGGVPGGGMPGGPTPAEIRKTMSALQRGWEEGRSQQAGFSEPEPGGLGSSPAEDAGPDSASLDSATDHRPETRE
jgi:hypothetical protein